MNFTTPELSLASCLCAPIITWLWPHCFFGVVYSPLLLVQNTEQWPAELGAQWQSTGDRRFPEAFRRKSEKWNRLQCAVIAVTCMQRAGKAHGVQWPPPFVLGTCANIPGYSVQNWSRAQSVCRPHRTRCAVITATCVGRACKYESTEAHRIRLTRMLKEANIKTVTDALFCAS